MEINTNHGKLAKRANFILWLNCNDELGEKSRQKFKKDIAKKVLDKFSCSNEYLLLVIKEITSKSKEIFAKLANSCTRNAQMCACNSY